MSQASRYESWDGNSKLIKFTSQPNSLVQIGKLRPSKQDLPKVILSATEPRKAEPPRFRLAGLSREVGLRRRGRRPG